VPKGGWPRDPSPLALPKLLSPVGDVDARGDGLPVLRQPRHHGDDSVSPRRFDSILVSIDIGASRTIRRLNVGERWTFIAGVLSLAAKSPVRGALLIALQEPVSLDDIAEQAGVTKAVAKSAVDKLVRLDVLEWDDELNGLIVVNWNDYQREPKASDSREAWKSRKQKQRDKETSHAPMSRGTVTRDTLPMSRHCHAGKGREGKGRDELPRDRPHFSFSLTPGPTLSDFELIRFRCRTTGSPHRSPRSRARANPGSRQRRPAELDGEVHRPDAAEHHAAEQARQAGRGRSGRARRRQGHAADLEGRHRPHQQGRHRRRQQALRPRQGRVHKRWGKQRCEHAIRGLGLQPYAGPRGRSAEQYPGSQKYADVEHALGDEVRMEKLEAIWLAHERPSLLDQPTEPEPDREPESRARQFVRYAYGDDCTLPYVPASKEPKQTMTWPDPPPIDKVLGALHARHLRVVVYDGKPDSWSAQCPAHDDRNPSLSIHRRHDGVIGLHCWAGCPTENVVASLGLEWGDLWEDSERDRNRADGPPLPRPMPDHLQQAMRDLLARSERLAA
jgi:hypothetical protein